MLDVVCNYDVPTHISKAAIREELEELRRYRAASDYTLNSLVNSDVQSEFIIRQLRSGVDVEEVFEGLQAQAQRHSSSTVDEVLDMQLLNMSSAGPVLGAVYNPLGLESDPFAGRDVGEAQDKALSKPWTVITSDDTLINHLLTLYFCWEYPISASLSKKHFLDDFGTYRPRYCSAFLVNAILAVGSLFSKEPADMIPIGQAVPVTSQQFFSEAERLWTIQRDSVSLTAVQALGMMSIFEASQGRDSQSMFYSGQSIRMAVGMGLHRKDGITQLSPVELEVRSATIWGAFSMDV